MDPNSKYYGICFDRRSQNFGFHMIARSQLIADDRKRSQSIAEDRTWFYLLRSSAITIAGSQMIAEVCFHMIADDRRTFCDLRSAIRDRLRSYGNQPLVVGFSVTPINQITQRSSNIVYPRFVQVVSCQWFNYATLAGFQGQFFVL